MGFVGECSYKLDKSLVGTLTSTLGTMNGSYYLHEHIIEMLNIVVRLKAFELGKNENFLVQLILSSLSFKYRLFSLYIGIWFHNLKLMLLYTLLIWLMNVLTSLSTIISLVLEFFYDTLPKMNLNGLYFEVYVK
ncbi:hypothetical protein V8G54_004403 [Vigna mungo]|uniref:Uncharacterized protein n=1 Tax=Vigna mungo TaxID=3915 RepID=A0AAQ3PFA9_VIGMU